MKTTEAEKLFELQESGHIILIQDDYYVDSDHWLYKGDDDVIYYDSHVYSDRALTTISKNNVRVGKELINW